jgi:hypothetical protein
MVGGEGEAMKQIVLRAYQLARSGKCATFEDIKTRLAAEGFHLLSIKEHLVGPTLLADLTKLCEEAKAGKR